MAADPSASGTQEDQEAESRRKATRKTNADATSSGSGDRTLKDIATLLQSKPTACPLCQGTMGRIARHFRRRHPRYVHLVPTIEALVNAAHGNTANAACPPGPVTSVHPAAPATQKAARHKTQASAHAPSTARPKAAGATKATGARRTEPSGHGRVSGRGNPTPSAVTSNRGQPARSVENEELHERAADAKRPYAHSYRDRGQFGSHPAHDGYGDDDRP
jgi:hypothetical protein